MKKLIYQSIIFILAFCFGEVSYAGTAQRDPYIYTQPDGTKITLVKKGDEFYHWEQTVDGYTALINEKGFYVYAILDKSGNLMPSTVKTHDSKERDTDENAFVSGLKKGLISSRQHQLKAAPIIAGGKSITKSCISPKGENKMICILVSFKDSASVYTKTEISDVFNKTNYSRNGAKGCVRDYYLEASYGQLEINTDVYGPYTVSKNMAYYGSKYGGGNAGVMAAEALALADGDIDYSQYDNDGNGVVEGVYFIFAGLDESEKGPEEAIWAHVSGIQGSPVYDGMSFDRYGCSSEARKVGGRDITRIGVICHEMGHLLGSPDFYDTNYLTDGEFEGTGSYDLMCDGNWNDLGNLPSHPNGYIKTQIFKWATANPISVAQTGLTIKNNEENTEYYYINTPTLNEYFLLENRSRIGFDVEIPVEGLIIYHVHSDLADPFSEVIAKNIVNAAHPQRMYLVCSSAGIDPTGEPSSYGNSDIASYPEYLKRYTGFTSSTLPSNKAWNGQEALGHLTNIDYDDVAKLVTFDFGKYEPYRVVVRSISASQIQLTWETVGNNDVIISSGSNSETLKLENGRQYEVGESIGSHNKIIYKGPAKEFIHSQLTPSTSYYYHIWAILDSIYTYSDSVCRIATTKADCNTVYDKELTELFKVPGMKDCWVTVNYEDDLPGWSFRGYPNGTAPPNLDYVAIAGGNKAELISPAVNCKGYNGVRLAFIQSIYYVDPTEVSVSYTLDNGKTWTRIGFWKETMPDVEILNFVPTNGANTIKFKWETNGLMGKWFIGNVRITSFNKFTNVSLSPDILTMKEREKRTLQAVITPSSVSDKTIVFTSSNPDIATVDPKSGLVTAINPGVAIIKARAFYDGSEDSTIVNVLPEDRGSAVIITIRARGTRGDEHINLLRNDNIVGNGWVLSSAYKDFTDTIHGDGDIKVEFDNDSTDRDVQIDYILVNGEKRQAENMTYNTGFYANGRCGGGSKSEWLNCNGVIGFGNASDNFGENTIIVRAKGTQGGEHINLLINGNTISGWNLTTSYQEYTAKVNGDGDISVQFNNDAAGRDVQIDWVKVNIQDPREAENMSYNTGFYANGRCGGGSYSEWLNCNGVIGFGRISDNPGGGIGTGGDCSFIVPRASSLPSLNKTYSYMHVIGSSSSLANINKFTINWSLPNNGLWDISYNTSNGAPNWYLSLMGKVTQTFSSTSPSITISGSGISILDGDYWVTLDGDNLVMAHKSKNYAIYCSNSATPPCSALKSGKVLLDINEPPASIKLFPNPTNDGVSIEWDNIMAVSGVKICDLTGKIIYTKSNISGNSIYISGLNKGIYIVTISCNNHEYNKKLVVN